MRKTKITHAKKEKAHFLGTDIHWKQVNIQKKVIVKRSKLGNKYKTRILAFISMPQFSNSVKSREGANSLHSTLTVTM